MKHINEFIKAFWLIIKWAIPAVLGIVLLGTFLFAVSAGLVVLTQRYAPEAQTFLVVWSTILGVGLFAGGSIVIIASALTLALKDASRNYETVVSQDHEE